MDLVAQGQSWTCKLKHTYNAPHLHNQEQKYEEKMYYTSFLNGFRYMLFATQSCKLTPSGGLVKSSFGTTGCLLKGFLSVFFILAKV